MSNKICAFVKHFSNLIFSDYDRTRLFSTPSSRLMRKFTTNNNTFHYHILCVFVKHFKNSKASSEWRIVSTNKDLNGAEFISTVEHKKYPFYGIQYHPEKNIFEHKETLQIPHHPEALEFAEYFGNFFINEARKNNHTFYPGAIEENSLIHNYSPVDSISNSIWEELYLFTRDDYNYVDSCYTDLNRI